MRSPKKTGSKGLILVNVLVFAFISLIVITALIGWATSLLRNSRQLQAREQAFQIAEAGVDYYRWHLAHAASDYKDGTATSTNGPFTHNFLDKDGNVIGQYSLTITPPPSGSSVVKIQSTGTVSSYPGVYRKILATLAIPSLAKFAVAANDDMRFGAGTEVFGPIHSNQGIRFDGLAHNLITSAVTSYDDDDSDDCNSGSSFGVHTCLATSTYTKDPSPPAAVPSRPDVFMAGRQFPVSSFDFSGLTTNLSQMKALAATTTSPTGKYIAASGAQGYHIVLQNNDTFKLYKVTALQSISGCDAPSNQPAPPWGTWSIKTETPVNVSGSNVYPFPANGIIFVEDNLWIEGTINTARLTIAAGTFPDNVNTRRSITINNDLMYTHFDGSDSLGLIAQGDINVGLFSDDNLTIDGALVAQNGRVGRYYYDSGCSSGGTNWYNRSSLTLYGMIATNQRYGFSYTDGTGYAIRNINYDGNLLYAPPPSFPLTSNQYSTISWEELK